MSSLPSSPPVGLIGIGLLGRVLAERLLAGGFVVRGYDLDSDRLAAFHRVGGFSAPDAATVLATCPRVVLSLPSHREVGSLLEAQAQALPAGLIVVDTTTGDPATSEALARDLAPRGVTYLDATQALAIMRHGPAYSRIMDGKGDKMLIGNFTPEARLSQHLKDVRLIVERGQEAGLPMPLYLPELFPTPVRATGSGISYNVGRFATAAGVLAAGFFFTAFGGSYPAVGATAALIYGLGIFAIWFAPDTAKKSISD